MTGPVAWAHEQVRQRGHSVMTAAMCTTPASSPTAGPSTASPTSSPPTPSVLRPSIGRRRGGRPTPASGMPCPWPSRSSRAPSSSARRGRRHRSDAGGRPHHRHAHPLAAAPVRGDRPRVRVPLDRTEARPARSRARVVTVLSVGACGAAGGQWPSGDLPPPRHHPALSPQSTRRPLTASTAHPFRCRPRRLSAAQAGGRSATGTAGGVLRACSPPPTAGGALEIARHR